MSFSNGHALVVGVGHFKHHSNLDVPVTVADANAVAGILANERYCGYPAGQVIFLSGETATKKGLKLGLQQLADAASEEDTVFIFLCSHGVFGTDGQWYFTTHDVRMQGDRVVAGSALSEQDLIGALGQIKAQRVFVVFNACFSGAVSPTLSAESPEIESQGPTSTTNNAILGSGKGRIIITASGEDQFSFFAHGEEHTIFTGALVEALEGQGVGNKNGFVSAFDLYEHVFETVSERVDELYKKVQHPELTILKGIGSFAVSLYRGASTLGQFEPEDPDREYGQVREISERKAQRAFTNILGDGAQQFNVGGDMTIGGDNIMGDRIGGNQINIQGDQTNINTGGGSFVQGDVNVGGGGTFVGRDSRIESGGGPVEINQFFGQTSQPVDPTFSANLQDAPANLRANIVQFLSAGEIKSVCFDLGIDYNRLPGQSLDEKVAELVLTSRRKHTVPDLIRACRAINAYPDWNE